MSCSRHRVERTGGGTFPYPILQVSERTKELHMIIEEKRTEGIKMTGKILAGVSLSLALVTCVAMGVQGGDNDWENGCVQETCSRTK